MTDITTQIKTMHDSGKNLGQIEGWLRYEHDYTVAESKQAIKTAGLGGSQSTADWSKTVGYLRDNLHLDKKKLINGMCEVNNKTYLTNQHAYNYIAMAVEWAKQEANAS